MLELLVKVKEAWDAGGVFIYPIHVVAVLAIAIMIERFIVLFTKCSMNTKSFLNQLAPAVARGDFQAAVQFCDSVNAPGGRLAKSILLRAMTKSTRDDIDAVIESSLNKESHPIERRTSYLSMLANIATLVGLLGTISGLIVAFGGAAQADPAQKAEILASGIAEAMNCTAYGLVVAITALLAFAFLQGKTQSLLDELKEVAFDTKAMLKLEDTSAKKAS